MRELLLKWHYRSKHESLIAFSNWYYYGNRLHTFASAAEQVPELGVKLVQVRGFYNRGACKPTPQKHRLLSNLGISMDRDDFLLVQHQPQLADFVA